MSSQELFSCDYPIYSVGRLGGDDTEFYVAGGGGQAKTGVPNALDIYRLGWDNGECVSVPVHHHDMDTSLIMNSATHPKRRGHLAVGVGGECCAVEVRREEKAGQGVRVKRRKKSQSTEDVDKKGNSSQSCSVVTSARVQTDFSKESYQRVVSFTCDGRRVVTGGSDSVIRVWEYPSLKKVCELKGHDNEIESLTCHPSEEQVVSVCRGGRGIVWDLTNQEEEETFMWSPGQHGKDEDDEKKPLYRFRACCFSPRTASQEHTSLYALSVPIKWIPKQKQWCYLLKWDAGTWMTEEERRTGNELLSALAVEDGGRYVGVGTVSGSVLIYTSHLQLLVRVSNVHTVFVTGLAFIPVATAEAVTSSPDKQVSKPDKLALISVSADRTCSATLVRRQSGRFTFILFFIIPLAILLIAIVTKYQNVW